MPVVLFLLTLLPGRAVLTGTWTLDRIRSDFGRAEAPRELVLQVEQTGNYLSATVFKADANGQRVSYRQCRVQPPPGNGLSCLSSDGVDETWRVSSGGNELTITRVIATKSQIVRQRLVLERSTTLDY